MEITDEKRKEYINSLYSSEEQKQLKESLSRYESLDDPKKLKHTLNVAIQDYLLLDEKFRLVKKHLNISDDQIQEIWHEHRIPSKGEEEMLRIMRGD